MSKKNNVVVENKTPYFGITFDLFTEEAEEVNAWQAISYQAKKRNFSHPQGSVYVVEASPATEEDAVDNMVDFLKNISKRSWANSVIRNAQIVQYRNVYDAIGVFKEDEAVDVKSVSMKPGFKHRKASAGSYEKRIMAAAASGEANMAAVVHDNGPHFGIVFDINQENNASLLKEIYGETKYLDIYRKVRKIMEANGFKWVQGSTYICTEATADTREGMNLANSALTELYYEYGFKDVVKDIKVVEFYRRYDITFMMKDNNLTPAKKALREVPAITE